jgi:signal transduction histidine kinase
VRDNGIGINSEMLPRVFDLFVQAEAARGRDEGGLGIGLALARKIAEMHGGTVRARSAGPNKGSEFTVAVPLAQPAITRLQSVS